MGHRCPFRQSHKPWKAIPAGALRRYPEDNLATHSMRTLLRVRGALPFIPPNEPPKSAFPPPNPALTLKSALRSNPPAQASAHPCCQKELKAETHCARRTFQPPRRQSLSRAATAKKNDEGRLSDASCETQKFFLLNLLVPCIWVSGKANATGGR